MEAVAERYPDLFQILGGYLHQDWPLEYASADEALDDAIRSQGPDQVARALDQLDEVLATVKSEDSVQAVVVGLCDYYPPGDHRTWLGWLAYVRERMGTPL